MFTYRGVRLGWRALAVRTIRETIRDDGDGLAAQLGYYFFLSLFPALLFLIALASLFPLQNLTDDMVRLLEPIAPSEVIGIIQDQMLAIASTRHTTLVSLGLLGTVWASSAAMGSIINAVNRAYRIVDTRSWWHTRLLAVGLTVGLAFFILISFTLVVIGPELADVVARMLGLGQHVAWAWKVLEWPLVLVFVATAIGIIYHFAPDAVQEWVWVTPGAVLATALWIIASLGFRLYVVNFGSYLNSYGTIGGVIVLLLWLYMSGLVIVVGAELNAEIERASPWGRTETEPGRKRLLGAAAARAYREHGPVHPSSL